MCMHTHTHTHTPSKLHTLTSVHTLKNRRKRETEHDVVDRKQHLCYKTDKCKLLRTPPALFPNCIYIKLTE